MTDRIDLDDLDVDETDETADANPGDWLWRDEGHPDDEPEPVSTTDSETTADEDRDDGNATASEPSSQPAPHVPRTSAEPAGIPTERGGSDTGPTEAHVEPRPAGSAADGPHGGGVDEMTIAFTYDAVRQFETPAAVFADATGWADWIGIVGDVDTHRITKFQRTHGVDADFFTGSGTDPAERLREIDQTSMFFAERMAVVGVDETDEAIAEAADWEYVPLEVAAEKADWDRR